VELEDFNISGLEDDVGTDTEDGGRVSERWGLLAGRMEDRVNPGPASIARMMYVSLFCVLTLLWCRLSAVAYFWKSMHRECSTILTNKRFTSQQTRLPLPSAQMVIPGIVYITDVERDTSSPRGIRAGRVGVLHSGCCDRVAVQPACEHTPHLPPHE